MPFGMNAKVRPASQCWAVRIAFGIEIWNFDDSVAVSDIVVPFLERYNKCKSAPVDSQAKSAPASLGRIDNRDLRHAHRGFMLVSAMETSLARDMMSDEEWAFHDALSIIRQRAPKEAESWCATGSSTMAKATAAWSFARSFTTKIHLRVNAAALPMRSDITPGQTSDYPGFNLVVDDNLPKPSILLADRGHISDKVRETMSAHDVVPVIPMGKSRKLRGAMNRRLYRLRNLVKRCFNKLKKARRVATRYDKTKESVLGLIESTSIRLWLRHL